MYQTDAPVSDLQATAGALLFRAGQTAQAVTISVKADLLQEQAETFTLELLNATHASIGQATGTATVLDDDVQLLVTGADAGGGPHLRAIDPRTGQERFAKYAFGPTFLGGVRVASADVSGDGIADVIAAAGPSGGPHVRVFDGTTGEQLPGKIGNFYAYDPLFTGGVQVAAADINADGFADVITGADAGGGPHVRVFSGRDGTVLSEFFAFDSQFAGGVNVAAADMNRDGIIDIIAGCGAGGPPEVRVFDGLSGKQLPGPIGSFLAYDSAFSGGVFVAAGDLNGDRQADIITGAAAGGGPHVRAFDGTTAQEIKHPLASFYAYDSLFKGGVRVGTANLDGDDRADLVLAPGPGMNPQVRAFRGATGEELNPLQAYAPQFVGVAFAGGYSPADPLALLVDPLLVLDANDGLVLTPERVENEVAGWTVDLRAQLYGATAATYNWDLTNADGAINVSGQTSPRLQFNWAADALGTYEIVVTAITTGNVTHTQTLSFRVDPPENVAQLTTAATWPTVVAPDRLQAAQETVAGNHYELSLASGGLNTRHPLSSVGQNSALPGLVYSSLAADNRPIFLDRFELDPTRPAAPPLVSAKLTFNGVVGQEVFYDSSLLNPGNLLQIALQADATSLATGRYNYQIDITSHYATPVTATHSGQVNIINQSSTSVVGPGWSLAGIERLWPVSGGIMLEMEGGLSLWFASNGSGGFTTPAGDTSMLMQNMDGTYTRTFKDGVKLHFSAAGLQTSMVDRNGNTTLYAYTGGQLSSITDSVGLATLLSYTAGKISSVTDPAARVTQLAYDGSGRLTSITDPDNALWQYAYGAGNRLSSLTDSRNKTTGFVYNFAGRASLVNRADGTQEALTAYQMKGLVLPPQGTQSNPAVPTVAVEADADYTDPRGQLWQTRLDWMGFGRGVQMLNPLAQETVIHRDGSAFPYFVSDGLARRTRTEFDLLGNPLRVWLPDDAIETYQYNTFSQVTRATTPRGYFTRYTFDGQGNLTEVILPDDDDLADPPNLTNNPKHTFTYSPAGDQLTATDPLNFTTSYAYDTRRRVTQITEPDDDGNPANNPKILLAYDNADNLTSRTDQLGFATVFAYDAVGRLTQETRPDDDANPGNNPVYAFVYDAAGNMTSSIDPLLHATTYTFDPLNRPLTVANAMGQATTLEYDAAGNLKSSTNALGKQTQFGYDLAGRRTTETNPLNQTQTSGYDAAGQRTSYIDSLGRTTLYEYSDRGWLMNERYPTGATMGLGRDADGNIVSQGYYTAGVCPRVRCIFVYDAQGRLVQVTDGLGNTTSYVYNARGEQVQTISPDTGSGTAVLINTYAATGQIATVTDPLGQVTTYAYNAAHQVTSVTASPPTLYTYDAQQRVKTVTDPEGGLVTYGYDLEGRLASLTDPVGNVTSYAYDNADRLTTRTDPLLNSTTYAYDAASRLTSMTDRNGRQTTYEYDDANRRTAEKWLDGMGIPLRTITYAYNAGGELTSASDPDSTYTNTYTTAGYLASVDNQGTPGVPQITLTYDYTHFFGRSGVSDTLGGSTSYGFDGAYRPSFVFLSADSVSLLADFSRDARGRISGITRGTIESPLITTTLSYDQADRVTNIQHAIQGGATLSNFAYTYNLEGELTSYTGPEGTRNYGYDETHQLLSADNPAVMGVEEVYDYDANGNRTLTGYQTGANNRLLSDGTYNYTFDNEGNRATRTHIASGELHEYTWDYRNRLTKVIVKNSSGAIIRELRNTYDMYDRRIGRWLDPDGAGAAAAEQFWTAYDGPHAYADFSAAGQITDRYLYGPGIDMLLARVDAVTNEVNWYLTDKLGSVRQIVDEQGAILDAINYDSYGNILTETNPAAGDRFKYTAREWEAAIDQYFYRARWYDAGNGRFISEDPIEFAAGDPNLTRYVGNSPTTRTDPTGEIWPIVVLVVFGVVVFTADDTDDYNIPEGIAAGAAAGCACYLFEAWAGAAGGAGAGAVGTVVTDGVGTLAVNVGGLGAGTWPAVMVNGVVYVGRMHNTAWVAAGCGTVQKYGMVIIDKAGKVIGWAYE